MNRIDVLKLTTVLPCLTNDQSSTLDIFTGHGQSFVLFLIHHFFPLKDIYYAF